MSDPINMKDPDLQLMDKTQELLGIEEVQVCIIFFYFSRYMGIFIDQSSQQNVRIIIPQTNTLLYQFLSCFTMKL